MANRKSNNGKRKEQRFPPCFFNDIRYSVYDIRFSILFLVIVGMMMCIVENAFADEFKLTPSLAVKEEYNDNVLYTRTNVQSDFITTISPGLALRDRTERMDIYLSGRLDRRLYSSQTDLNATDQYYQGAGKYALSPRLNLSGKAFYSDDAN